MTKDLRTRGDSLLLDWHRLGRILVVYILLMSLGTGITFVFEGLGLAMESSLKVAAVCVALAALAVRPWRV